MKRMFSLFLAIVMVAGLSLVAPMPALAEEIICTHHVHGDCGYGEDTPCTFDPATCEECKAIANQPADWCGNALCSQEENTHVPACDQYVRSYEECKCVVDCAVEGLNAYCETCYFEGVEACNGEDTNATMDAHNCTLNANNWTPLTQTSGTLSAGSYYLTKDLRLSGTLNITSGTVNLCLKGHSLYSSGSNRALAVTGGILNIVDCVGKGAITGTNSSSISDGSSISVNGATVNMYSGKISGNTGYNYGTIFLDNGAVFNMKGGSVSGNKLMSDGQYGGAGFYVRKAKLVVDGGSITGNSTAGSWGGGIYCTSYGTVELYGGTISGNSAGGDRGDGIFYSSQQGTGSTLFIGGSPNIVDDIYLDNADASKYPFITSVIKNGLTLTLSNPGEGRVVAQGNGYNLTEADLARITLQAGNTPYYAVLKDTTNQIIMSTTDPGYTKNHYVKYHANGGQGTTEDNTPYTQGTDATVLANNFTRTGWSFAGWNTKADGSGTS